MPYNPRRGLRRRRRGDTAHQLEELYYFLQDVQEDVKASLEETKKKDEDKNKKSHESVVFKKYSFGTLVFWIWGSGPVFGLLWYFLLRKYI